MKYFVQFALFLAITIQVRAQTNKPEFNIFLKKLEVYTKTHYPRTKQTMPIAKLPGGAVHMPVAPGIMESFMEDPETGLRHYPHLHELYDPATGYYIEYDSDSQYYVDTKTGKIFKGESEVQIKNRRNK